jgi:hypothetical protein
MESFTNRMDSLELDRLNYPPDTKGRIGFVLRNYLEVTPLHEALRMLLVSPHYALLHGIATSSGKHRVAFWEELREVGPTQDEIAFVQEFSPELFGGEAE